ncbi:hypothetical protein G7046_g5584 [Stylonectria norvegica]|nr:hypothetical protein G7046_g5584 [Stylonectria norvegica]
MGRGGNGKGKGRRGPSNATGSSITLITLPIVPLAWPLPSEQVSTWHGWTVLAIRVVGHFELQLQQGMSICLCSQPQREGACRGNLPKGARGSTRAVRGDAVVETLSCRGDEGIAVVESGTSKSVHYHAWMVCLLAAYSMMVAFDGGLRWWMVVERQDLARPS